MKTRIGASRAAIVVAAVLILSLCIGGLIRQRLADLHILRTWFGSGGLQVESLAFSPDGNTLAVGYNHPGLTCLWDVTTNSQRMLIEENEHEYIHQVSFSPDGDLLAVGVAKMINNVGGTTLSVRMREADTGTFLREIAMPAGAVFGRDKDTMVAGDGVRIMPDGAIRRTFRRPDTFWSGGRLSVSRDGKLMAIGGHIDNVHAHPNTMALVFDVGSGCLVKSLKCPDASAHHNCHRGKDVDFHPDAKHLVIGTVVDVFYVWNIETDDVSEVRLDDVRLWAVRYSPDGRLIAAGGAGGKVLIWDTKEKREVGLLTEQVGSVYAMEFSPSGSLLATGGMDGTVRLWGITGHVWKKWGPIRRLEVPRKKSGQSWSEVCPSQKLHPVLPQTPSGG